MLFKNIILFLVVTLLFTSCSNYKNNTPIAKEGRLDLTLWDFNSNGFIDLNGEWEFYFNELITPHNFQNLEHVNSNFIETTYWNNIKDENGSYPRQGFATYRMIITTNSAYSNTCIESGDVKTASRLWCNGKLIYEQGKVGNSIKIHKPGSYSEIYPIELVKGQNEIVLQISNFSYRNSGIQLSPKIGTISSISAQRIKRTAWSLFSFGVLIIIGFYHIILYLLRNSSKPALYFGIFILIISLRILASEGGIISFIYFQISWETIIKIMYFSFLIPPAIFGFFIAELFPNEINKKIMKYFFILSAILFLNTLFLPSYYYSFLSEPFYILLILLSIYVYIVIIRAVKHNRRNSVLLLIGTSFLLLAIVYDVLISFDLYRGSVMFPKAFLLFIFLQTYQFAFDFSRISKKNEELAVNLQIQNLKLEEIVEDRTRNLKISNSELKKLNIQKDKFISIISHDLKGPIGGIMSLIGLISDRFETFQQEQIRANCILINDSVNHIYRLLENLLTWSRVQSGKIEFTPQKNNLNQLVNEVISLLENIAKKKDIEVVNKIEAELEVLADTNMLNTILRNLITNALKFSHVGSLVEVGVLLQENNKIKVYVQDHGVGISEDSIKKIFNVHQSHSTRGTAKEKGTGLGLILCQEFAKLHHTEILIDSRLNVGSRFSFDLEKITY